MQLRYVRLSAKGTPIEKLSAGGHPLERIQHHPELGVLVPEPYVVLDFDTRSDARIALEIIRGENLNCLVLQTTRGIHAWFKSPEPMKNSIKARCASDLYYDVRSYGKLSYVKVKTKGKWREWIHKPPEGGEIMEIPAYFRPLRSNISFKDLEDGDGRNSAFFEYILHMQTKGFTREEIRETLGIINKYVVKDPLSESELETICREEAFKDDDELVKNIEASIFNEEGKFQHHIFAHLLVENLNVVTVNEVCYVYKDGYYQASDRTIEKQMIRIYPGIRRQQRAETLDYIKILSHVKASDVKIDEWVVNLQNTRLDVRTDELLPFDPQALDFCRLPVSYDPLASCPALDGMLRRVFQGDEEVLLLFEEMIGYLLVRNCRYRKGFLFYGGGSNGKSTVLNMIRTFCGSENTSTIEMDKLSDKFKTAELENKLVNIGDDLNQREIGDTGTLKKLFTGEGVTVERKGQDPFTLHSYAKLLFSSNSLPRIMDKTHGMYSRLMLIPFNARFSPDDADFDPFIEEKVTTPEAMSHLLNMGLRGIKRLIANNQFTMPQVVVEALSEFKREQSTVLTWIDEENIDETHLVASPTDALFSEFRDWCVRSDIKYRASIRTFHRDIEEGFGFTRKRVRNQNTGNEYKWFFMEDE